MVDPIYLKRKKGGNHDLIIKNERGTVVVKRRVPG